ncbi:MAG TPA: DUF2663 family protein [Bacillales bacterium]|nr:DUF2663 family protein [Bacillales bacterium]
MEEFKGQRFGMDLPEITIKLLSELVDRKEEAKRCKTGVMKVTLFLIVLFAVLLFYTFVVKQGVLSHLSSGMFPSILSDPFIWLLVIGMVIGFFRLKQVTRKYEEAEDDYEALRCELIDRSEELWPKLDYWKNRHHLFKHLEMEHEINLYHKQ